MIDSTDLADIQMESHYRIGLLAFAGHHPRADLRGVRRSLRRSPGATSPGELLFLLRLSRWTRTMRMLYSLGLVVGGLALLLARDVAAQAALPVYTDHLVNGFQDWGWATRDYANPSPVHSGTASVAVTLASPYQGLQIYHPDMDSRLYSSLSIWINGGASGGQRLQVYGLLHVGTANNAGQGKYVSLGTLPTNTWQRFVVPLSALGVANRTNF